MDNNNYSTFCAISTTDPVNTSGMGLYGFRVVHPTNTAISMEIAGRPETEELFLLNKWAGVRKPIRKILHSGNLDTANIVNRTDEQYINGTKRFSHKLYANGGVYTGEVGVSDNYWQMGSGLSLYYAGTQIMACYPTTNDRLRWYAPFEHRDTVICDYSSSSGENVVAHYIKNNSVSDSTSASINFGFSTSAGYHHAAIKGMRTNRGASNASSIYLQARPAVSGIGTGLLEDVVEAGFDDQQAFVQYHNNPSIIHDPDSLIIATSDFTFNPHRGSYAAYSNNPPHAMTLGSGEHGQTTEFCIVDGTFPLTIVYEGGYVVTEYGKIYKFKYMEGQGWFKYD